MHDSERRQPSLFRKLSEAIKRFIKKEPGQPEDPYAFVMAPKRRPPNSRSAAAVLELPEE